MANTSDEYVINENHHWLWKTLIIMSNWGSKKARQDRSITLENSTMVPGMRETAAEGSRYKYSFD